MLRVIAVAAIIFAGLSIPQAGAGHKQVFSPCDEPTGYRHLTIEEMQDRVDALVPHGLDLESLTVTEGGLAITASPSPLLFEAGVVQEFALDHNGVSRHYGDPYWEYRFAHLPNWSFWEVGCTTAPPPTTTTTVPPTSTTTAVPATSTTSTTTEAPATTTTAAPAATTTVPTPTTTIPPTTTTQGCCWRDLDDLTPLGGESYTLPPGYDLHTAQYHGWPFRKTILLLELRYPPGVPGKTHFPLSVAQHYLTRGGTIGQLDWLWNGQQVPG